mgnify:CR=1 FL=1
MKKVLEWIDDVDSGKVSEHDIPNYHWDYKKSVKQNIIRTLYSPKSNF